MGKAEDLEGSSQESTIRVRRSVYKQKSFDDEFQLGKSKASDEEEDASKLKETCSSLSREALGYLNPMNIVNLFTVFNLIASYDFKKTLVADLLSGLTVGVMHIPGTFFAKSSCPIDGLM